MLILTPDLLGVGFGDIDNKLKTICDALRHPSEPQEIPKNWVPKATQIPLVCLLEDDNLITKFSVNVDRLLKPVFDDTVFLMITAKIKGVGVRIGALSLIT
jgi:hypothetical protein